ncbi:MAG: DUF433 domain-containing protein [Acidobacteriota bacterium]|nr:DUF433 domain-containing protein [Blastocatellia bacterium]MDW8241537.1 DUF433 domain-containing protein [Acidobacteriota bacterium]
MSREASQSHSGSDPRELPAYFIQEAARYLVIPVSTIRSWVVGYPYSTQAGQKYFKPIIVPASKNPLLLSFINLIEIHILAAIRREHKVRLQKVRKAIDYLKQQFHSRHPLADQHFETDGVNLFVEKYGQLIGISQDGQLAMKEVLRAHLHRIERDMAGIPVRLYPFTTPTLQSEPRLVVIDPRIAFGQPVIVGTGIRTATIAARYKAGESIHELADDYDLKPFQIEEAIRCELHLAAA